MGKVQIGARVDEALKSAMDRYCKSRGVVMNHFIQEALLDRLEELEDVEELKQLRHEPTVDRGTERTRSEWQAMRMIRSVIAGVTVVLLASLLTVAVEGQGGAEQPRAPAGEESQGTVVGQIEAQLEAKAQRTPAQRKVSSQLLDAYQAVRGQPAANESVMVDIRTDVTPAVLERIGTLGGMVINSVPRYRAIRAQLPLAAVETLAAMDAIQSIRPADEAVTRDTPDAAGAGTVNPPEGGVDR